MEINMATQAKLRKETPSLIGKEIGESRQRIEQWIKRGVVPDAKVLELSNIVGYPIKGKWSDGKRERCEHCDCERICRR